MSLFTKNDALPYAPEFYKTYLKELPENVDFFQLLTEESQKAITFYQNISQEKSTYKYAEDKWTIKDVLQHVIDTERIMCYRALRFARYDLQPLLGFDENRYASNAHANKRTWIGLLKEFNVLRQGTQAMFENFDKDDFAQKGTANNKEISVSALAFVVLGHEKHHRNIIQERYLIGN